MKNFNINRFFKLLKWNFFATIKTKISMSLGVLLGIFFSIFIAIHPSFNGGVKEIEAEHVMGISLSIIMFAYFACISYMFTDINKKKQSRINYLMLPGTNFEKWLSRILEITLTSLFILVITFLLSDLLQMLLQYILGYEHIVSLTKAVPTNFSDTSNGFIINNSKVIVKGSNFMRIMIFLFSFSSYVLGGSFYRKNPFVLICLTQISILLFVAFIVLSFDISPEILNDTRVNVFLIVATLLNFTLSYVIFKRLKLVQNKFFNI